METRPYMLCYQLTASSAVQKDFFMSEDVARTTANRLYRQGYVYIELLRKQYGKYCSLKVVRQKDDVAAQKHDAYIASLVTVAQDYQKQLFNN